MNEALPCPFCGSPALEGRWPAHFACSDKDCGAYCANLSLEQWNRRPSGWTITAKEAIEPTHEAADAFWKYWRENGETHKHGYYESTWGAINAALNASQSQRQADER